MQQIIVYHSFCKSSTWLTCICGVSSMLSVIHGHKNTKLSIPYLRQNMHHYLINLSGNEHTEK